MKLLSECSVSHFRQTRISHFGHIFPECGCLKEQISSRAGFSFLEPFLCKHLFLSSKLWLLPWGGLFLGDPEKRLSPENLFLNIRSRFFRLCFPSPVLSSVSSFFPFCQLILSVVTAAPLRSELQRLFAAGSLSTNSSCNFSYPGLAGHRKLVFQEWNISTATPPIAVAHSRLQPDDRSWALT